MNEFKMKFLPVILTAASVAFAAENNPEINRAVNRIDVGRQEVDERGGALVRSGNELFADGQYLKARDKYLAAIKVYEPFAAYGSFHEKSEYCRKRIGDCYYQMAVVAMRKADELAQSRDYDEAIKECREALKFCEKEQQDELNRLIEVYEKRRDNAVERESASVERQIPNIKEQEYQIQVLMEQGRKLALNREYGRAARKFQEALLINPFNGEALQCLRAVNDRIGEIGHRRFVNEHRRQLGELEWKSAIPYRKSGEDEAQNLLDSAAPKRKPEKRGNELSKRLAEIKLPRVNLPEYTVAEVVEYIRTESVRHDPAKLGVNIVFLRSGRKAAAENTANNDAPSDGPTDDGTQQNRQANPGNTEVPATEERITLDIKNDSIINVLDKLCSATRSPQMRYQIDDNAVLISPVDVDLGGLQTDTIQINLDEGVTDEDLKTGMLSQGIKFSPGAAVTYNAKLGRVVIRNDSENLNKMRAFLETKKKNEGAMIQLQIKLVEMMQEDIDELAFNWQYAVNANQSYYTDGRSSVTPLSGGPRELTRASVIQSSSNELLRYYVPENHTTTSWRTRPIRSCGRTATGPRSPRTCSRWIGPTARTRWRLPASRHCPDIPPRSRW
ncbi:MAG: hypothetical protein IKR49_09075 [Clostridia bacterium]|nr:hypothetical protein [Clostridia bacterium]